MCESRWHLAVSLSPRAGLSSQRVQLIEKDLTEKIIGACITVRKDLGRGYLESVYRDAVMIVLDEDFGESERSSHSGHLSRSTDRILSM